MNLGELIRSGRKKKKLTQKELGELINVSFTTISHWEKGNRTPSATDLIEMTKVLDDLVPKLFPEFAQPTNKNGNEVQQDSNFKIELTEIKKRLNKIEKHLGL